MTHPERLLAVFRAVFGDDSLELSDDTSAETLEGWDSARHLELILALEAEFGISFDVDEIADLASVGAIRERLPPE